MHQRTHLVEGKSLRCFVPFPRTFDFGLSARGAIEVVGDDLLWYLQDPNTAH